MQFNSMVFVAFFLVVLGLHRLPISWRFKKFNLLWLSYLFYAGWHPPFVALLWISTIVDWELGKRLHAAQDPGRRKLLLGLSLTVNLGMLSFFKYSNFLLENFVALLSMAGVDWTPAAPDILLPVGISFYTFQTLSYTLDIHARRMEPAKSFLDYALFVSFFPQLVAGPIVRAGEFLPQCEHEEKVSARQFGWGLSLIVIGLFDKVVIADGLLAPTVERVFDTQLAATFADGWLGSMGFACQVFCDFAGYSLCAIGAALCLGFRLPVNFRFPLASASFADFWRRWHISLSTWLRDYVYMSLGGRRVNFARWAFNLLVTWMATGLWHGAAWRYVLFGINLWLYILIERAIVLNVKDRPLWHTLPMQFCFACIQFIGFSISMTVFRSPNVERMFELHTRMFTGSLEGTASLVTGFPLQIVSTMIIGMFLWHWVMRDSSLEQLAERSPWWLRSLALSILLVCIVLMPGGDHAFIYFQF